MCCKENCNHFLKDERAERMFSDYIVIKQKVNHKTKNAIAIQSESLYKFREKGKSKPTVKNFYELFLINYKHLKLNYKVFKKKVHGHKNYVDKQE